MLPPKKSPRHRSRPAAAAPDAAPATGDSELQTGRIAKVLARAGVASRRGAEAMIRDGRVSVNGEVLTSPARDVTPQDRILVDDQPLAPPEPMRLWLYHKPVGLVTTALDEQGRPTVFERLPEELPRVMPVGRLDLNSEGLLLLTNDGGLKRQLELPSTGWVRKYRVRVNGRPDEDTFAPLRAGIVIEGERFQPMVVTLDRQQGANAWLTVAIREGRNREVRRAMAAVGLTVNRLIRVGYGPFQLGDLAAGAATEVRPRVLREQLGPGKDDASGAAKGGSGRRGPAGKPASHLAATARTVAGPRPAANVAKKGRGKGKVADGGGIVARPAGPSPKEMVALKDGSRHKSTRTAAAGPRSTTTVGRNEGAKQHPSGGTKRPR